MTERYPKSEIQGPEVLSSRLPRLALGTVNNKSVSGHGYESNSEIQQGIVMSWRNNKPAKGCVRTLLSATHLSLIDISLSKELITQRRMTWSLLSVSGNSHSCIPGLFSSIMSLCIEEVLWNAQEL